MLEYQKLPVETQRSAQMVVDYLRIEDQPVVSDVIFILGGSKLSPVEKAAELYTKGFAPKVAFISVGGRFGGHVLWGMPEYKKYKEVLLEHGIPENPLVYDGLSTNTLEEAQKAIPFLHEHHIDPQKIILVSRPVHQRRAYATFQKQWPQITYVNCPAQELMDLTDPEDTIRLVQEVERLITYGNKGDLAQQEIPTDILQAANSLREQLKSLGLYNW